MREFVITDASMPRLDSALLAQYPQLSPGRLHKYLRENKIKVDGKKLPLSARLPRGSTVRVFLPDMLLDKPDGPLFLSARPELCAVYEDSDVLVADKPAGLPVTDEDGRTADTLINRALLYLYHKGEYAPERGWTPRLCHRLDTGTSGLVLIAKTQQAEALLLHLVKERMIEKKIPLRHLWTPLACGSNTARLSAKGRPTGACAYSGHTRARSKRYCDKI